MFGYVEKLRASLRNLAVVSQLSASPERASRKRFVVFLNYYSRQITGFIRETKWYIKETETGFTSLGF